MTGNVVCYTIETGKREVVMYLPLRTEILGVRRESSCVVLDMLQPRGSRVLGDGAENYGDWTFRWTDGDTAELDGEQYIGTVLIGPGEHRWSLFLVD